MHTPSANTLATAAIVLGAIAVAACFLTWADPRRPAAEIEAELRRGLEAPERPADAPKMIGGLREAYPQAGTEKPLHGAWVAALVGIAVLLTMIGASLKDEARSQHAETIYRLAGAVFALAVLVVLIDCSSGLFQRKDRAAGLWIALGASLAAALAVTFASARLTHDQEAHTGGEQDD